MDLQSQWSASMDGRRLPEPVRNGGAGHWRNLYVVVVHYINETYLTLMVIDLTAAFSYTALIFLVPRISSPSKQRLSIYIWCTLSVVLLAILLSFLRVKNPC